MSGFAAETNDFLIPSDTSKESSDRFLSPETSNWENQADTTDSNENPNNQSDDNKKEANLNLILEDSSEQNSQTGEVITQAVPAILVYATVIISKVGSRFITAIQRVAALKAAQTFRAFTYGNIRYNLAVKTGGDPGSKYQAHHIFPNKFASRWGNYQGLGFNHNNPKYGTWVDKTYHLNKVADFNKKWDSYFEYWELRGKTPSMNDILAQGKKLANEFNMKTYF